MLWMAFAVEDLSDLMDIVPPIDVDFDEMDERSAEHIRTLDHAIDMAVCAQDGTVNFKEAAKAIFAWLAISKAFFDDPPTIVKTVHTADYVKVHNRLLRAGLAASNADGFHWEPSDPGKRDRPFRAS